MFRIKTDVRQYKCESRDKVVRLIRNWVIRPTDEIYNEQEGVWEPIGEHEAFTSTFREMEKAEEGVAETVVSPEIDEEGEDDSHDEDVASRQTDVDDSATSTDEVVVGENSEPDEVTAVTQADPSGDDDIEPEGEGTPEPPTAPEGVTQGREYADSDEITVMTEETLDTVLEDEEAGGDIDVANEQAEEPRDDLQTVDDGEQQSSAENDAQAAERAAPDEPTDPQAPTEPEIETGDDAVDGASNQSVDESPGGANQARDEAGVGPEPDGPEADEADAVTSREDLPEEVFATNRIERDPDDESSSSGAEDAQASTATSDESDEEEWDEILQRLRDTDELDGEEIDQIEESRDDLAIGRDEPVDAEPTDQTEDYYGASGGYDWELPDYVAPTPADREHGLESTSVTESDKDAVFPYPGPKQKGHVQTRAFDLSDESDTETSELEGLDDVVRVVAVVFVVVVILVMLWAL